MPPIRQVLPLRPTNTLTRPSPASVTEALRYTKEQALYYLATNRFNVVPAGRRSGKTAIAKRRLAKKAKLWTGNEGTRFIASAPIQLQAKNIYWSDLKRLIPPNYRAAKPSETELTIQLINGAIVQVMGMDEPARVEGSPVAHILLDEYGNMAEKAWTEHVRPMLAEFGGSADLIGTPEGRNHYYQRYLQALKDTTGQWKAHTWRTVDALRMYLPSQDVDLEIESAKASMDPLTFDQEYNASFVSFEGRAYYTFLRHIHQTSYNLPYYDDKPIFLCFDFNRKPGVCAIAQEQVYTGANPKVSDNICAFFDEVWIPTNSSTEAVCEQIQKRYRNHKSLVYLYGDATGGAKTTSSVEGSDWDIITNRLRPIFKDRLKNYVPRANPPERIRVNAVNARFMTADGIIHSLVSAKCQHLADDFDGVQTVPGTNGDILKEKDSFLTHISDAAGYMMVSRYPFANQTVMEDVF